MAKKWNYFPSPEQWKETDGTDRVRQSAGLLVDAIERHDTPITNRTCIALFIMKRALAEENR